MHEQNSLNLLINFLNIKNTTSFACVLPILRTSRICRYVFCMAGEKKKFSLLTRQEVLDAHEENDIHRPHLNTLKLALVNNDPTTKKSLLTNFSSIEEDIVFPEDIERISGVLGQHLFMKSLLRAVEWFQHFMAGCEAGYIDVQTLNDFKFTKGFIMEFQPSKNPMNPMLSVAELYDTGDDIIERKLLCNFIYPFLFSGQGSELMKVRKCRYCGTYFIGKRISATFCRTKCRNSYYYEHA